MDMRINRATAVVVQQVPEDRVDWFLGWQRGITKAMEAFAGHQATDIYPPPGGRGGQWVVVVGFDEEASLKAWLDSKVRAEWVGKLSGVLGAFDLKVMGQGFGPWFAGCAGQGEAGPPGWKMALTVLFGLYPTVMLLTLFPGPLLSPLGLAGSMLIGNALSVCLLQWAVMPVLTKLFASWLAGAGGRKALAVAGTLGIFAGLAVLVALFRQVTG